MLFHPSYPYIVEFAAKVHPFLRIYKLWGRFLWVLATEIEGMCGFCRDNQVVSRVV